MSRQFIESPICNDTRPCFGIMMSAGGFRRCQILTDVYENDGECPFCKEQESDIPNADLRKLIAENNIMYKQIAMRLGISKRRLSELMCDPLSERNRKRIKKTVMEIVEERECLVTHK